MHESDAVQREWKDCVKSPTVKVTDFYGNEGTFQLAFNDSDNFDIPGIV
ncbi:hypothetical protein [Arsenophonus endosymbiont of Aleurodicus floccissimus]|nr:hypothetical protein [Arsenophonus endosymbiont of Aleurodicus floccissimus]